MPDCGHTQGFRGLEVPSEVVDEDALVGSDAEPPGRDEIDLGVRLSDAELAREHDCVEEVIDVVVLRTPRVRDERGADALSAVVGDRVAHRLSGRTSCVRRRARPSAGTSSWRASRRSNVARSIRPHSRSASALGSSRNARRTSGPSRAWKASKESSMLVVSTPPQSIRRADASRAMSRSAGPRCRGPGACAGDRGAGPARGTPRARASRGSPRAPSR